MWWLVAPFGPGVTMIEPAAVTVSGWQVAQLVSGMFAVWLAVAGGMPWQLPQVTAPVVVHTGRAGPWHPEVAQVPAVRSQPRPGVTSAGSGESMCPGDVIVAGTWWQVAHAIGPRSPDGACRCA